jgi:hypothetical protein
LSRTTSRERGPRGEEEPHASARGQQAPEHGLPAQGVLRSALGLPPRSLGPAILRKLALGSKRALATIARALNPLHRQIFTTWPQTYYWSAYQSEWSTDLLFKTPQALAGLHPALVRHAIEHFASPDLMRFLGRNAHGNFTGEPTTSFKDRPEGVRVKHWVHGNSIKMYDKAGRVLRVETTIAKTADCQGICEGRCVIRFDLAGCS